MNNGKTKIIATIGDIKFNGAESTLCQMIASGVDVVRFNFSHAKFDQVEKQIRWVRAAAAQLRQKVYILADLAGPKIRLGEIKGRFHIKIGDELGLAYGAKFSGGPILPVQFDFSNYVSPKQRIFLFDGKIEAEIVAVVGKVVKIVAKTDGYVTSHNGINLPDTSFIGDALTSKDLKDLEFIAQQDFDWVGLSFVHTPEDIEVLRKILAKQRRPAALAEKSLKIVAKIETKSATEIKNLARIIKASDGVMVARGDLAYEIGAELVPVIQSRVVKISKRLKKFSIVATQMMASMVDSPTPTRAEVSDVARAVFDGVNYVLLAEETAIGKHPNLVVEETARIIKTVSKSLK